MARRRTRYEDRRGVGRSRDVPFQPGEGWKSRHGRRLEAALNAEGYIRAEAMRHGIAVIVTNNGHHWRFEQAAGAPCPRRNPVIAEWWPSSAKLVIRKRWADGVHVHDAGQLLRVLFGEA